MDLYAARAPCFENLTLTVYYRTFQFQSKAAALNLATEDIDIAAPEDGTAIGNVVLHDEVFDDPLSYLDVADTKDAFGNQVMERKGLVRFSHNHPAYQSDGFFYNLLVDEVCQKRVALTCMGPTFYALHWQPAHIYIKTCAGAL